MQKNETARSKEAYDYITKSGVVSGLHVFIYKILYETPALSLTSREICEIAKASRPSTIQHSITPRMMEMKKRNLIYACGKKKCQFTGRWVTLWCVTTAMPGPKSQKSETKIQRIKKELKMVLSMLEDPCGLFYADGFKRLSLLVMNEFPNKKEKEKLK
jgi:hypothetical protein